MNNNSIQTREFQYPSTCQDVKMAGDFARPGQTNERAVAVGGAREAVGWGAQITPENFAFYVHEAEMQDGRRSALVMDRALEPLPPPSNTGATVTLEADWYKSQETRSLVDWFNFTLPVENIDDMLGCIAEWTDYLGGFAGEARGRFGYAEGRLCNDGACIFWHPERLEMKVCVSLSGTALQTHALRCGSDAWVYLMTKALDQKAKFSRVDIALDTTTVDFATVQDCCPKDRELVTRSRQVGGLVKYRGESGNTVMIGDRSSRRYVRIYDKAKQMGIEGQTWVRFEVELKGEYAQSAAIMLIAHALDVESLLSSAIDFREVTGDSNVTRRPRLAWWAELMDGFKRVSMTTAEKVMESYERTLAWLRRQVAPAMAFMSAMNDGGVDWFYELLGQGRGRISPEKRLLISAVSAATLPVSVCSVMASSSHQGEFGFMRLLDLASVKAHGVV